MLSMRSVSIFSILDGEELNHHTMLDERKSKNREIREAKDGQKEKLNAWVSNLYFFFVNVLFTAYKRDELLKEKVKENRLKEASLAQQRQMENEELEARLRILLEEEAKRQDYDVDITVTKEPLEPLSSVLLMSNLP